MDVDGAETRLDQLAIVVVTYGSADLLPQIADVARALRPARLVVVDNFSTEDQRAEVRRLCAANPDWLGVYPDTNLGFGGGCNLGADAALDVGCRYLLFLNPDATIDRASVSRLVDAVAADPDLLIAPTILTGTGRVWSSGVDLDLRTGQMRSWRRRNEHPGAEHLPWVSGACFVVSANLWQRVGGFDDDYFLYWEDVDLCAKVSASGGRIEVSSDAVATHDEGQTHTVADADSKSPTYYYYNIRNRAVFAAKWLTDARAQQWRRSAWPAAYQTLLRGGRRQFLHPWAPLRAAWRGLRDGRRLARRIRQRPPVHTIRPLA